MPASRGMQHAQALASSLQPAWHGRLTQNHRAVIVARWAPALTDGLELLHWDTTATARSSHEFISSTASARLLRHSGPPIAPSRLSSAFLLACSNSFRNAGRSRWLQSVRSASAPAGDRGYLCFQHPCHVYSLAELRGNCYRFPGPLLGAQACASQSSTVQRDWS